jgi:hypothetical protein
VRAASAAIVTVAVTFAIGGMIAFCRADDSPALEGEKDADPPAKAFATAPTPADSVTDGEASRPTVRRWGDPEPEPLPQASAVASELAAIRERVGIAVPDDWQAFGVSDGTDEATAFEKKIETLEADAAPSAATPVEENLPPTLADPGVGAGGEISSESPEALGELTKSLSTTARDLENTAHVLEERRRYEDADRLRRLAMRLRRENRRLLSGSTGDLSSPGPSR